MTNSLKYVSNKSKCESMLKNLERLFKKMDAQYEAISEQYGFNCSGCKNNCCTSNFHHHTLLEYLYINKGFNTIPIEQQYLIEEKAILNNKKLAKGTVLRIMCPLNIEGQCIIYRYRPMICRLHGVSHTLSYTTGNKRIGQGCHKFEALKVKTSLNMKLLDRTYHYKELAYLELETRKIFWFNKKIKMTISEMIIKRSCLDEIHKNKQYTRKMYQGK